MYLWTETERETKTEGETHMEGGEGGREQAMEGGCLL